MKILFVATRKNSDPADRELYEMDFMNQLLGFKRSLLDLGIVTVAACTPKKYQIQIVDEYLEPIPYDTDADLIALSAKTSCVAHAYEVAKKFREQGKKVVLGGIHASLRPAEALEHVDHVVVGEAEMTWPLFLEAFEKGTAPPKFGNEDFPEMSKIPVPAWENLDNSQFLFHQIQTTRGCPFTCRFCSVPDIAGSTFRFKPIENVVEEIKRFPKSGGIKDKMKAIYFVDDNFISKTRYTKDLLAALIPLYEDGTLGEWSAETTLNVARDEEMLDLFAKAGCSTLIIGFESISEETLLSMDKKVNFCLTYPEAIHRIHERGMSIVGNFIVGFDSDTVEVFNDLLEFIDNNSIVYPFFSILTPMPGTRLHEDVKAEGRIDHYDWAEYDTRHVVFEPKQMTREQLMDGYCWLYEESYTGKRALDRLSTFWQRYERKGTGFIENAYISWRLRRHRNEGSSRFRTLVKDGWKTLKAAGKHGDVGQLVYYYDSGHFCDYLDQFRSENFEENVRIFRGEQEAPQYVPESKKQWESKRSKGKGRIALPVVT
jgi:radical SAM superfamily enzyme YgiQ (UPF0313 family)